MSKSPFISAKMIPPGQVAWGLFTCCVLGVVLGLATSELFYDLADIPEAFTVPPPPATVMQTVYVSLSLFGMVIWPGILTVLFCVWFVLRNRKVRSLQWKNEQAIRETKSIDVEEKIRRAKLSGDFDKFNSTRDI